MINSVVPLQSAMVPSSSEHTVTTIKVLSGSAYLFQKSSSGDASSWAQVAKLTAADGAANDDYFGWSVAIRDGIAVVGAQADDDKGSFSATSSRRALPTTRARGRSGKAHRRRRSSA